MGGVVLKETIECKEHDVFHPRHEQINQLIKSRKLGAQLGNKVGKAEKEDSASATFPEESADSPEFHEESTARLLQVRVNNIHAKVSFN